MTTFVLKRRTIVSFLGKDTFNDCHDVSDINVDVDANSDEILVTAHIPGSTTNQPHYRIKARIRSDGTEILRASCTCPVGKKCKHIHKVLYQFVSEEEISVLPAAKRRRFAERVERPSVYIVFHEVVERNSSKRYFGGNVHKVLGVFQSKVLANECAKTYVADELEMYDDEEDDEDDTEDVVSYYGDLFDYSKDRKYDDAFDRVWVACHEIQDGQPLEKDPEQKKPSKSQAGPSSNEARGKEN